jgi:hypothetical protein
VREVAASAVTFVALIVTMVAVGTSSTERKTAGLTAREIYDRYLEKTNDVVFIEGQRHSRLVAKGTNRTTSESRSTHYWNVGVTGSRGLPQQFIDFVCSYFCPVEVKSHGIETFEGQRLLHLTVTSQQWNMGSVKARQELYIFPSSFEPYVIETHFFRPGSEREMHDHFGTGVIRTF